MHHRSAMSLPLYASAANDADGPTTAMMVKHPTTSNVRKIPNTPDIPGISFTIDNKALQISKRLSVRLRRSDLIYLAPCAIRQPHERVGRDALCRLSECA